jgi:hypothetical protein
MAKPIDKIKTETAAGVKVLLDPGEDLRVGNDISKAMAEQPALFAFYGVLAEEAEAKAKKLKYQIHCKEEDLDKHFRERAIKHEERLTEQALKNRINRHSDMRTLYEQYLTAKRTAGLLVVLKEAFRQRAEILRSIGANKRIEVEQGELQTLKSRAQRALKEE